MNKGKKITNARMNVLDHLDELRVVLLKSLGVFLICLCIVLALADFFIALMYFPIHEALNYLGRDASTFHLRTDGPFSIFTFLIQLAFFGGCLLGFPFMLYFIAGFITPGLLPKEKKKLRLATFLAAFLFLAGVAFAFTILLPAYFAFSLKLGEHFDFVEIWTPGNYFGSVLWTSFALGLVFESPIFLLAAQSLGYLTAHDLRKHRRTALLINALIAALLTPGGDPLTLLLTTIPLTLLYEFSIFLGEKLTTTTPQAPPPKPPRPS